MQLASKNIPIVYLLITEKNTNTNNAKNKCALVCVLHAVRTQVKRTIYVNHVFKERRITIQLKSDRRKILFALGRQSLVISPVLWVH